jgi:hypothetical protein
MLIVQVLNFVTILIRKFILGKHAEAGNRMEDIALIIVMISYTLMYFGFSRMVKSAY